MMRPLVRRTAGAHVRGRVERTRRGFTLMELTITATIAVVFATMIAQTIISATQLTNQTLTTTVSESEMRNTVEVIQRFVRGARPLASCVKPAPGSPADVCTEVVDVGSAFLYASPTEIRFYAFTCAPTTVSAAVPDCATNNGVAGPPDLVVIKADRLEGDYSGDASTNALTVTVYRGNGTYTDPSYTNPLPAQEPYIRIGRIEASGIFSFYSDSRTTLGGSSALSDDDLGRIALVEINLQSKLAKLPDEVQTVVKMNTLVGIASRQYGGA